MRPTRLSTVQSLQMQAWARQSNSAMLASVPPSMPDDTTTLFLLETRILPDTEACILFSCRGMVEQLHRYSDEVLCCTVDTKMKVAHHGYGVATFGILTHDKLRKTSLAWPAGRAQVLAPTSHTVPIAQAIVHQETDMNYQRLFRPHTTSRNGVPVAQRLQKGN